MSLDFAQEIANLAQYHPDYASRTLSVTFPNWRDAKSMCLSMKLVAQVPDYTDPLWTKVERIVWKEYRRLSNEIAMAKPRVQELIAHIPHDSSPAGDEARIRSMKGPEVALTLASLGLKVEPHPTNAGITVMRGKNTLLHFVRKGGTISVPPETKPQAVTPAAPKSKWVVR